MRLTPAQRLVLYHMAFEALYHGKSHFTFEEIRRGTGLSVRTLRSALLALRRAGYIESFLVPGQGKRLLHRPVLTRILPEPELEGIYLVDVAGGVLTPDAISVISRAEVVLHTRSVDPRTLEGYARRLELYTGQLPQASSIAVAFSSLTDWPLVAELAPRARYICASNALDRAIGLCLTCGDVDLDLKTVRIVSLNKLKDVPPHYQLYGTILVQGCGGRKAELAVLRPAPVRAASPRG